MISGNKYAKISFSWDLSFHCGLVFRCEISSDVVYFRKVSYSVAAIDSRDNCWLEIFVCAMILQYDTGCP